MTPNEDKVWIDDGSVTNESVSEHLGRVVEAESVQLGEGGEELGTWCDVQRVRKMYKLGDRKKGVVMNGDSGVDERKEMEAVILGLMALKGS